MPDIAEVHGQVAEVADLPAAEFEGRIFRVTGTDPGLYRDNGASWDQVSSMGGGGGLTNPMTAADSIIVGDSGGPGDPAELVKGGNNTIFGVAPDGTLGYRSVSKGFTRRLEDPGSSGWTSVNGSGAFYADGMWIVSMPQASSDSLHARVKAATAGTNRQYFGFIVPGWTPEGDIEAGICLNDSASGGFVSLTIGFDNSGQLPCTRVTYWTDANTHGPLHRRDGHHPHLLHDAAHGRLRGHGGLERQHLRPPRGTGRPSRLLLEPQVYRRRPSEHQLRHAALAHGLTHARVYWRPLGGDGRYPPAGRLR
jgi:hypothetical protein